MGVLDALSRLLNWIYARIFGAQETDAQNPFAETIITAPDGIGRATIIGLGATLAELWVPDAHGKLQDVVLGYDDRSLYLDDPAHPVFGAMVGRVAGRISNGQFKLDGKTYKLVQNDGTSTIHGGRLGWDRRAWTRIAHSKNSVTYQLVDDANEGFPGRVTVRATYELLDGPELKMSVRATTTERTPLVVSNHSYWNLDGHNAPFATSVHSHKLRIRASRISALGDLYVPTGALKPVAGTAHDFTSPRAIGDRWSARELVRDGGVVGYNDNWIYDPPSSPSEPALSLTSPRSGIHMEMRTNQPSVVLYSAIYLDGVARKAPGGGEYKPASGIAIEQQAHADAVNHPEWGVDVVLSPGDEHNWWTACKFSVVDPDPALAK